MSLVLRRYIPMYLALGAAIFMILNSFFSDNPAIKPVADYITNWVTLIGPFLLVLGVLGLLRRHATYVQRRASRWYLSAWLIGMLLLTVAVGLATGLQSVPYLFVYNTFYTYPFTTVATLHGFSTVVICYRMVRARNIESTLFAICAIILYMMNASVGPVIWPGFSDLGLWVNNFLQASAMRAVLITAGLAAVIISLKTLVGMERGWLGRD